jgi:hypothetical protein
MLPDDDPAELFGALRALPFVELGAEGLVIHDTVRAATSALLQASDPARHRAHRRASWTRLRVELRTAEAPISGVTPPTCSTSSRTRLSAMRSSERLR